MHRHAVWLERRLASLQLWRHQTTECTFADVCFHAIVFKEARDTETEKEASESRGRDFHVPIHHHTQTFIHTCGVQ